MCTRGREPGTNSQDINHSMDYQEVLLPVAGFSLIVLVFTVGMVKLHNIRSKEEDLRQRVRERMHAEEAQEEETSSSESGISSEEEEWLEEDEEEPEEPLVNYTMTKKQENRAKKKQKAEEAKQVRRQHVEAVRRQHELVLEEQEEALEEEMIKKERIKDKLQKQKETELHEAQDELGAWRSTYSVVAKGKVQKRDKLQEVLRVITRISGPVKVEEVGMCTGLGSLEVMDLVDKLVQRGMLKGRMMDRVTGKVV